MEPQTAPEVESTDSPVSGDFGAQTRSAAFTPSTVDESARTVELVWTTGASVRRYDWYADAYYDEVLEVSPEAVRMGRMASGAPLLLDHYASTSRQVGVVESARIEGGKGYATVRFSKRKEVEGVWQDVKDGILRSISVGYKVHRYEKEKNDDGTRTYRAVDWEPLEISLVPVPADAGASVRSEGAAAPVTAGIPANKQEKRHMEPEVQNPAAAPTVDENAIRSAAAAAERARVQEIRTAVRSVGLGDDVADRLIDAGTAIESARAEILSAVAARQSQNDTRTSQPATIVRDERETLVMRATEALHSRATATAPTDAGRELRGLSLVEMARRFADAPASVSASQAVDMALSQRSGMHSTSDFAHVLASVVGRTLRDAYAAEQRTYTPFVREVEVNDFRPVSRIQLGDHPELKKVSEGAEFTRGTIGDSAQSYAIATYGRIVSVTRQAIVNDDLSAFSRIPSMQGAAAARLESALVYGILSGNPAMSDGKALFHAAHGNLLSAALDVAGLAKVRAAGRKQKTLDGQELNVAFAFLIVNPDDELAAEKVLGSINPTAVGDFNPFVNRMRLIVDPRVPAGVYFTAATPTSIDTIEVAYLSGQRGLQTFTKDGWDVDGVEVKARLDVAAAAIDHRGLAKATIG